MHSISHQTLTTYWQTISLEELKDEFGGERELVAHFADIPIEDIGGMRLPFLQLSGNYFIFVVYIALPSELTLAAHLRILDTLRQRI